MRTSTTLILFLLAGLIGAAIYNLESVIPSTRDTKERAEHPLQFDAATVDAISIEAGETTTTLAFRDRFWYVGKPLDDVADPTLVQSVLKALNEAEWLEHLKRTEMGGAAWKLTGLDKPATHVKLSSKGAVVAECWLGNASAIEGAAYLGILARTAGQMDHYVVRTPLPQVVKKSQEEWRDARLVRVPAESVSRITISDGHGKIEMARDKPNAPWDLVKPLLTRGHNDRINELLATVLALKITALASTGTSAKAIPQADALNITLQSAAAVSPLGISLVKPTDPAATKADATASHRAHTFTIASERLNSLWVQLNDVRDDRLARVDTEKVDGVIVKSGVAGEVTLRKQGESWQLQHGTEWEPANGAQVAKMFDTLNNHQVREFVADSAANLEPYGLNAPFLTVAWNDPGDKPTTDDAVLQTSGKRFAAIPLVGTETELQFGQDAQGSIFAKYEGESIIYRVGASVLQAMPRDNVRWKALNPVRFSQFALVRIAISVGTNPPVILDHHPVSSAWSGARAGEDLTPLIDQVKADRLVDKLGGLVVQDWVQDRTDGTKALQNPVVTIQITLLTQPGNAKSPTKLITVNFSPTVSGTDSALYYGRVDNSPDIFLITRDGMRELLASVLKSK
ncbi:MAG: hypothetical protein JWO08_4272 [Verrucomicrobiaceae bacterium]|nr:hypothetical protein [Verrucomicrobiaceae bacterium]